MLFSNGFHRGSHYRPPRSRVRRASGAPGLVVDSPGKAAQQPHGAKGNATTIVTVRDTSNPGRMKTIITLKRRQPSGASEAPAAATPRASPAKEVSTPSSNTKASLRAGSPGRRDELAMPNSPASTLLSEWKKGVILRSASYDSFGSARMAGSEDSCETALTQIDDGLSDWGLPKVIDYHGAPDQEQDEDDEGDNFEGYHDAVEPLVTNGLEMSAFPYNDPAVASLDYPVPSVAQLRLQRFIVLMYVALLLKKRNVVPARFKQPVVEHTPAKQATVQAGAKTALAQTPLSTTHKTPLLRILPFASWI